MHLVLVPAPMYETKINQKEWHWPPIFVDEENGSLFYSFFIYHWPACSWVAHHYVFIRGGGRVIGIINIKYYK
jgi:hypothetical protein